MIREISENKKKNTTDGKQEVKTSAKQELNFSKPVEGDVIKEFAKDNLLYSNTLQEWTTHMGIDIKADKTTVVKSAEAGTVKSIKNDPRYGLTIVIEHENGYQTVYSNLLSTEFVVEIVNKYTPSAQGNTVTTTDAVDKASGFTPAHTNKVSMTTEPTPVVTTTSSSSLDQGYGSDVLKDSLQVQIKMENHLRSIYEYLVSKSSGMPSPKEVTSNATIAMPESVIDLNKKRF